MPFKGEIGAIPQNEPLGRIAEVLKYLKEMARTLAATKTPTVGPLQAIGAAGEMLLGNKPEAVEGMSYGFSPLRGSGMALGPRPEYAPDVADLVPWNTAASTAVKGIAGKLAASSMPLAAGVLIPASQKAVADAAGRKLMGETPESIWKNSGVMEFPNVPGKQFPLTLSEIRMPLGPGVIKEIQPGETFKGKLSEFLNHPGLFSAVPSIDDYRVELTKVSEPGIWRGVQYPQERMIQGTYSSEDEVKQLLEHEIEHALQDTFDMPRGFNAYFVEQDLIKNPKSYEDIVGKMVDVYYEAGNEDFARILQKQYLFALNKSVEDHEQSARWVADQVYRHYLGEVQARMADSRALKSDAYLKNIMPTPTTVGKNYTGDFVISAPYEATRSLGGRNITEFAQSPSSEGEKLVDLAKAREKAEYKLEKLQSQSGEVPTGEFFSGLFGKDLRKLYAPQFNVGDVVEYRGKLGKVSEGGFTLWVDFFDGKSIPLHQSELKKPKLGVIK